MRAFLLGLALLAKLSAVDGIFGDHGEAPWDADYHKAPGWAATVEEYRQREYVKREEYLREAGDNAVRIATWMGALIPLIFMAGSAAIWSMTSKEAAALHDYVVEHHQTADEVDEATGAKKRLEAMNNSRDRKGIDSVDYVATVDGRFGLANHVVDRNRSRSPDTMADRLRKLKARESKVQSMIERAFAAVDTDGSGELTRDELRELLKNMGEPHGDADLDSYMDELDPDRSGTISFEEFRDSWLSRTDNGNPDNAVADTVARASKQAAKQSKLDQAALNSSS